MKYVLLILLLSGCATTRPKSTFECAAVGKHGVYAKFWTDAYSYLEDAEADAQKIVNNLKEKKLIPNSAVAICYKKEQ